jgi:hypothetical protein
MRLSITVGAALLGAALLLTSADVVSATDRTGGVPAGGPASAGRGAPAAPGSGTTIHTWAGDQPGERYGWAVADLADIDGDRVKEAIIGAPRHVDGTGTPAGHTDVRSGRTGAVLFRFTGAAEDRHGYAIADAGDVDGDGRHDIVVGATGEGQLACTAVPRAGRAYVYSGRTGAVLHRIEGQAAGDQFGGAVGSAGDVTGDGRADLLVGAPCHDGPAGVDAGRAYVVDGRTGRVLRTHDGAAAGDGFGWGIAGTGDLDLDRRGDYIVGAKDAGARDAGLAYVFSGRRGRLLHLLRGDARSVDFGWFFVAGVGDVDGDRRRDLYVGDFCAEDDAGGCSLPLGQAYVFSGRTGRLLHLFRGETPGDGAGPGRSAGDVDRDGRADIAVGLYASSDGGTNAGRVIVYSGRTGRPLFDRTSTVAGETLGYDVVGLGDVDGDGRADLLVSAAIGDTVYVLGT